MMRCAWKGCDTLSIVLILPSMLLVNQDRLIRVTLTLHAAHYGGLHNKLLKYVFNLATFSVTVRYTFAYVYAHVVYCS